VDRLDDVAAADENGERGHRGSIGLDKRSAFFEHSAPMAHSPAAAPDYDAEDTLVVSAPEQLRALGDEVRGRIIGLLRDRARSATELAEILDMPKGTVAHHLKVLEKAALIHVVRTRKVRAMTERYYGRVARLFLLKGDDEELVLGAGATALRNAAAELVAAPEVAMHALIRVRLDPVAVRRFNRRLDKLVQDVRDADTPDGAPWGVAAAMYAVEER
jgi:DNA-binding transcriptional ArsR family regulator